MTPEFIGIAGIVVLVALILFGFPIAISLIGVSFVGIFAILGERAAWGAIGIVPYSFAASWQLASVPMFLLMGFLAFHANLSPGLFRAARLWTAWLPGGLAVGTVFGAAGFSAVTGSSVACAAAMGRIAVPEMLRSKYAPGFAAGTVAASGTLGALIPPSILLILYGIIASVPISQLFLGGLIVGLITLVAYSILIVAIALISPQTAPKPETNVTWGEMFDALFETWPMILLVLAVFGGLVAGVFTPVEAGAVGASVALLIAVFRRTLTRNALFGALMETLVTSASLFLIAIGASLLARFLALSGADDLISSVIGQFADQPVLLILGIIALYLVIGMILEPVSAMMLTLPILLPVLEPAGFSLIWFGILMAKLLEVGMITPPIGLNVYVISSTLGEKFGADLVFRGVFWFFVADLAVIAVLVVFPGLI